MNGPLKLKYLCRAGMAISTLLLNGVGVLLLYSASLFLEMQNKELLLRFLQPLGLILFVGLFQGTIIPLLLARGLGSSSQRPATINGAWLTCSLVNVLTLIVALCWV